MTGGNARVLSSVLKAFEVLEHLAASPEPLGVSDLGRRASSDRATVYRQLQTLVAAGWVEQLPDARYRLTLKAVEVGGAALEQADIGTRVVPVLAELVAETGETASLAVLDGHEVLVVQRVESTQALKADIKMGSRLPILRSASGRVLLAHLDEAARERLEREGLELPTAASLQSWAAQGYAVQEDELMAGMSSVAVPFAAEPNQPMGALSLAAPTTRFDLPTLRRPLERVAQTASNHARGAAPWPM